MEPIFKLQPNRTLHLRGFDDRGAGAAFHSATENAFKVSGVFRDPADFCVLMLWDADNFFEHPRLKYLPDFDFSGLELTFDVRYEGLQPLDSLKFPTIDWPYLDAVLGDGMARRVPLFDYAELVSGSYTKAEATFGITAADVAPFDRVSLWYQNLAFDYIAAGGETAEQIATALRNLVNGVAWGDAQAIEAEAAGGNLIVRAKRPGRDGNMIGLYSQANNPSRLSISPGEQKLSGGSSDATWRVRLNFAALGLGQIRQMWLTFAPELADSAPFVDREWQATFTNWTVSGSGRELQVAGPGSVRIEDSDSWCVYTGSSWGVETGFYSKGFAKRAAVEGDSVTVRYHCQFPHEVWIGTSLYSDRGRWGVSIDGDAETVLDCRLANEPAVNTRRTVRAGVAPGEHSLKLTHRGGGPAYFDFLQAVVRSDVPDPAQTFTNLCPANDYGTDHTYKLSPARLMWILDKLGFQGPMNVYVSVFWWNQRKRAGAVLPEARIDFSGAFADGDQVFLELATQVMGKTCFPLDTPASIARHYALFINSSSAAVWARSDGGTLFITSRSTAAAYTFPLSVRVERAIGSSGSASLVKDLSGGAAGLWMVDPEQSPTLNRGAREWLADLLAECKLRGREITLAYSMELLNPPAEWAARFPDGSAVTTATGFATNVTTHCSFVSGMLAYQKRVFLETAALMDTAGVPVSLQVGEFLWWFFNNNSPPTLKPTASQTGIGMAFYDAETKALFEAEHGRPLVVFRWPDDEPAVNGFEDAKWLADRLDSYIRQLRDHVQNTFPPATIEILLPLDVNYSRVYGAYQLGGKLNHYVNIPVQFRSPETAPFDRVKMEALDFGAGTRSTDLAIQAMRFPFAEMNWPLSKSRYLIALFNGGCPWMRELQATRMNSLPVVNFWAFDHVCIFGWEIGAAELVDGVQLV